MTLLYRRPEAGEVDLLQRPLGHLITHRIGSHGLAKAVNFLVVARVVLDLGDHMPALDAADLRRGQRCDEEGIFTQRLGLAAPQRSAHDVDGGGKH